MSTQTIDAAQMQAAVREVIAHYDAGRSAAICFNLLREIGERPMKQPPQAQENERLRAERDELRRELQSLVEAHEKLLVDSRITKRDAKFMSENLDLYTGSARAALARLNAAA